MDHENKDALIADLQSKHPYTPQGHVEGFVLCVISHKSQCPHCMKDLMEELVYCDCGTCPVFHRCNTKITQGGTMS